MNIYSAHTPSDHAALVAAGVDPDSTEPRYRAVACFACRRPTANVSGYCDTPSHYRPPGAVARASQKEPPCPSESVQESESGASDACSRRSVSDV